ncbi:hypothetical protein Tco_0790329 [Tanacetum coccineum]
METIHVTFDEMHQSMAPARMRSGPEPLIMTQDNSNQGSLQPIKSWRCYFNQCLITPLNNLESMNQWPLHTEINCSSVLPPGNLCLQLVQDAQADKLAIVTSDIHHPGIIPRPIYAIVLSLSVDLKVKLDDYGDVLKNKARLVAKGYRQEEASRPDLVFAVCMCARYQAKPTKNHFEAIKRVFRYLKGTINMGLWYPKDNAMSLTAYADADHADVQDFMKKYVGSAQFFVRDRLFIFITEAKKHGNTNHRG